MTGQEYTWKDALAAGLEGAIDSLLGIKGTNKAVVSFAKTWYINISNGDSFVEATVNASAAALLAYVSSDYVFEKIGLKFTACCMERATEVMWDMTIGMGADILVEVLRIVTNSNFEKKKYYKNCKYKLFYTNYGILK